MEIEKESSFAKATEDKPSKAGEDKKVKKGLNKHQVMILVGAIVVLAGAFSTTAYFIDKHFESRVLPGVFVNQIDLGGLTKEEALSSMEVWEDMWWANQMQYKVVDERGQKLTELSFFPLLVTDGGGASSDQFIWYDLAAMVDTAFEVERNSPFLKKLARMIRLNFTKKVLSAEVNIDDTQLSEMLRLELAGYETYPQNAKYDWQNFSSEPIVISEQNGNIFDYDQAISDTKQQLRNMVTSSIAIKRTAAVPEVKTADARVALEQLEVVKNKFPLVFNYQDPVIDFERKWAMKWPQIYQAIQPAVDSGGIYLALKSDKLEDFWASIENVINDDPQNAKFSLNETTLKVKEFLPSKSGYDLNRDNTLLAVNKFLRSPVVEGIKGDKLPPQEEVKISLAVDVEGPQVSMADVNDFGITEIVGIGYSSFAGSPRNRIHNIGLAVDKLNGLLIKPEEEFSLLAALRPFTLAGGYLPELVIKGDEIVPEIGGGLCQIGTTTFRAVMKAGLDITERRNHSLVVSYYNDPRNGNPGTDATIYDSSPDFKFRNDTGNYLLLTTAMNAGNGDLTFTLWGTNDGRKAEYTEPVVKRWISAGPTKFIETTDLAPGQKKCQGAHQGASTSFTYTVEYLDGEIKETVYNSQYRALPTICLVGVDPNKLETEGDTELVGGEEVTLLEKSSENLNAPII